MWDKSIDTIIILYGYIITFQDTLQVFTLESSTIT